MNCKTFDDLREDFRIELKDKTKDLEVILLFNIISKTKLLNCVVENYEGIEEFRNEYLETNDKILIEDTKMLLKIFKNHEQKTFEIMQKLFKNFVSSKLLYNSLIVKEQIKKDLKETKREEIGGI